MWDLPELPVYGMASNTVVCGWFFYLVAAAAIGILIGLGYTAWMLYKKSSPVYAKVLTLLGLVLAYAYLFSFPAFQYTMCKRALLA